MLEITNSTVPMWNLPINLPQDPAGYVLLAARISLNSFIQGVPSSPLPKLKSHALRPLEEEKTKPLESGWTMAIMNYFVLYKSKVLQILYSLWF